MPSPGYQITIITPTFNASGLIDQCLQSVQKQTCRNFEHLIIDGMSTDDTVRLVESAMLKYDNIRLVSEKDKGIYDAMNKGISLSQSDWIYFLGADDSLYQADTFESVKGVLSASRADIIYGNVYFQGLGRVYDHAFSVEKILKRNLCHQSIFYRRTVFGKMGLFDLNFPTEADYAFNLGCWLSGRVRHQYMPVIVANYAGSGMSSARRDSNFVNAFPSLTINALLSGNKPTPLKIHFLSSIYRKIIQRKEYHLKDLWVHLFVTRQFFYRVSALIWMIVSLPFYFLGQLKKSA
jgi:glycosyltransferase involved in cell wall biosynthesis